MDRSPFEPWTGLHHGIMVAGRSGASEAGKPADGWRSGIGIDHGSFDRSAVTLDERAIVTAVLAGDRDAFRRLVERESGAVVRACHRILGDHGDAEDAAQEAFVIAYRSLATWRDDGSFGAWLTRIAVRIALRQAGRRRTVLWRNPAQTADGTGTDMDPADRAADRAAVEAVPLTDPLFLSIRAERATEIRAAVTALPEPYREVVALRFFGEASLDEIARLTDRPLGTVKTHLRRGLARLRARLESDQR